MTNVLGVGLELLVLGMGGVFLFLIVLVVLMKISASFFTTFGHLFPDAEVKTVKKAAASSGNEEIAVAIAAMTAHTK